MHLKVGMARPTWTGYLGFGLVQLPVRLYPATREADVDFTMLDRRDLSPVGYKRVNKKTKREVSWDDTVRGFEVSRGKYVVIGPNDLKAAHPTATRSIDITAFVESNEISSLRSTSAYFVGPDTKASTKAYVVLREALRRTGKVGVAKVVIRTRQHLCAVTVEGDAIVLAQLRFDDEMRDVREIEELESVVGAKATKKELDLAEQLIATLSGPFESDQYRDDYQDALREYIDKKVASGEVGEAPDVEEEAVDGKSPKTVHDLMEALQASLKQGTREKPSTESRTKRRSSPTPRRKATARRASPKKRATRKQKAA